MTKVKFMTDKEMEQLAINTIRTLSIDAIQVAKQQGSGSSRISLDVWQGTAGCGRFSLDAPFASKKAFEPLRNNHTKKGNKIRYEIYGWQICGNTQNV